MSIQLQFHKLSANAVTPIQGSKYAAGLDLSAAEAKVIPSKGRALVKTDLQVAIPEGCYGRIAPRSGLAYKKVVTSLIYVIITHIRALMSVLVSLTKIIGAMLVLFYSILVTKISK